MHSDVNDGCAMTVGVFFIFFAGCFLGFYCTNDSWKSEMIRRGYAEHEAKTGDWMWIDGKDQVEKE